MPFTTFKYNVANGRFEFTAPVQVSGELYVDTSGVFGGDVFAQHLILGSTSLPVSPHEGEIAFDQVSGAFFGYDGAAWDQLSASYVDLDTLDTVCARGNVTSLDIYTSGTLFATDVVGTTFGLMSDLSGAFYTHSADLLNPHETTFDQVRDEQGGSDVTLTELEELTDGSETTLHTHAAGPSTDTLDDVCDRGAETDQDIHSSGTIIADADLKAGADVHINYDGGPGDPTLYFHFDE